MKFTFTPAGFAVFAIWCYRKAVSPYLPDCCRFTPTCSVYGARAVMTHGAVRGGMLALWRILRCQPFCRGGYDPVPLLKSAKSKEESRETSEDR